MEPFVPRKQEQSLSFKVIILAGGCCVGWQGGEPETRISLECNLNHQCEKQSQLKPENMYKWKEGDVD